MSTSAPSPRVEGTPSEPGAEEQQHRSLSPHDTDARSTATPEADTPREKPQYRNRGLPPDKLASILRHFESGQSARYIASQEDVSLSTVYNLQRRVKKYGAPAKPTNLYKDLGRTTKIPEVDADALYRQLMLHGWMQQDEIVEWLKKERGIVCSRSTVSRLLSKKGWTKEAVVNTSPKEI
jgi:transposase